MTEIEALRRHLDDRLDKQDEERKAQGREIGKVQVAVGKLETALEEKVKSADKEHEAMRVACSAKHESVSKKIAVRDKYLGVGIVAVVGAAFKLVWDGVVKSRG